MPFIDNDGKYVKAGASLAIGLCSVGVNDENDLPYAILAESVESKESIVRQCSILGLGMAYAGRSREDLQ